MPDDEIMGFGGFELARMKHEGGGFWQGKEYNAAEWEALKASGVLPKPTKYHLPLKTRMRRAWEAFWDIDTGL